MITVTQWDAVVAIGLASLLGLTFGAILMWQHMEGKIILLEKQVKGIFDKKESLGLESDNHYFRRLMRNSLKWTDFEHGTGDVVEDKKLIKVLDTSLEYPMDEKLVTRYSDEMSKTKLEAKAFVSKHPDFMDKEMDDNYKIPKAKLHTTIKMDKPKKEKVKKPQDFYTKTREEMKKQKFIKVTKKSLKGSKIDIKINPKSIIRGEDVLVGEGL